MPRPRIPPPIPPKPWMASRSTAPAHPGHLEPPPRAARPPPAPPCRTLAVRPGPVPHRARRSDWEEPKGSPSSFYSSYSASSSSSSLQGSKRARALAAVSSVKGSSGFQSAAGSAAGFGSKALSAISTAGSFVTGAASQAATSVAAASAGTEKPQTWGEWARDWRDGRKASVKGQEVLNLLPGWAVKRPCKDGGEDGGFRHVYQC